MKISMPVISLVAACGAMLPEAADAQTRSECAQRGQDSLRIVWSREGGATQERLLAEAKSAQERSLIREVWRRPGAASTVQAAVEADCLERLGSPGSPAPSPSVGYGASPSEDRSPQDRAARDQAMREAQAREASRQQQVCANYNSRMDSLRARERTGGSVSTMDRLNEERRRLQAEQSRAGC